MHRFSNLSKEAAVYYLSVLAGSLHMKTSKLVRSPKQLPRVHGGFNFILCKKSASMGHALKGSVNGRVGMVGATFSQMQSLVLKPQSSHAEKRENSNSLVNCPRVTHSRAKLCGLQLD